MHKVSFNQPLLWLTCAAGLLHEPGGHEVRTLLLRGLRAEAIQEELHLCGLQGADQRGLQRSKETLGENGVNI